MSEVKPDAFDPAVEVAKFGANAQKLAAEISGAVIEGGRETFIALGESIVKVLEGQKSLLAAGVLATQVTDIALDFEEVAQKSGMVPGMGASLFLTAFTNLLKFQVEQMLNREAAKNEADALYNEIVGDDNPAPEGESAASRDAA